MDTIKNRLLFFTVILICFLVIICCGINWERRPDTIIKYNDNIKIIYEDASSGKPEITEVLMSEDKMITLINQLSSYNSNLSSDTLKKEFLIWYTIKLNDNVTLQIDAECDYSGNGDTTYMYVIQNNTKPTKIYGVFIDSSIIDQLKQQ